MMESALGLVFCYLYCSGICIVVSKREVVIGLFVISDRLFIRILADFGPHSWGVCDARYQALESEELSLEQEFEFANFTDRMLTFTN